MKFTSVLQHAAILGLVNASNDAYVWTVDSVTTRNPNQANSISSFSAERILARRRGAETYLSNDDSLIADMNKYGGPQPVFGSENSPAKILVEVAGYQGSVSDFNALPDLWIEEPETTLHDIFASPERGTCEYTISPRNKKGVTIKYIHNSKPCLSQKQVESLPSVMAVISTVPTADKLSGKGVAAFHRTLLHLAATENIASTLLVLPNLAQLKTVPKSELKKRLERPLDMPLAEPKQEYSPLKNSKNQTLPHNIPQFFGSKSACNNQTNSCSGHGKCVQVRGELYKCSCSATLVRDYGNGSNKTVQWGGNACQKKDISSQFLLFAGFGIFFTAIVAGIIGMMFDMGSQELPSVIGAGVVGPRAQR